MKLLLTGSLLALGLALGCGPADDAEYAADAQLADVEQGYHAPAICGKTVTCGPGLKCCGPLAGSFCAVQCDDGSVE